jgi:hypothetical protein
VPDDDQLRDELDDLNRALIEQTAAAGEIAAAALPTRTPGTAWVGPPDVPVTHFLDVGTVDADGLVDVELPTDDDPPFNRGGFLPGPQTRSFEFAYDPERDGPIIRPHPLAGADRRVLVDNLLARAGERLSWPALRLASTLRRRDTTELTFTTETAEAYRHRIAAEKAAAAAVVWARRDRIRSRRRRGRK